MSMTVPELIDRIMAQLQNQFYCFLSPRDFPRDHPYLIGAIATYGYECNQRGWQFDTPFIYAELCRLLTTFKHSGVEIHWMPNYLQHAIRQHLREHAEELSAAAKTSKVQRAVTKLVGTLEMKSRSIGTALIIEPTPVEQLGLLYKDVNKLRRRRQAATRARTADQRKQKDLL